MEKMIGIKIVPWRKTEIMRPMRRRSKSKLNWTECMWCVGSVKLALFCIQMAYDLRTRRQLKPELATECWQRHHGIVERSLRELTIQLNYPSRDGERMNETESHQCIRQNRTSKRATDGIVETEEMHSTEQWKCRIYCQTLNCECNKIW